ncbi:hypothetical protein QWY90_02770 [Flavobacterium paronense]|uniref:DUF1566 domain-containing protein n=1 Tax=Flavobacterium paronense TaxID=1392775 RepID=A0ABV5GCZ0_9FLAO|nr:hypothetical protein [Flavobacterium paronense]MDN3676229.1 hypothetical protein [Flavobacterium paronense]
MKTINALPKIFTLLFVLFTINSCKDIDDTITYPNAEDLIQKDSELFDLLNRVTKTEDNPMTDIVCIDFVYPIHLLIYNSSLEKIGSVTIIGDDNFSAFLGILPADQSLSISYPITTTLADGTEFTVNNNTELKLAIDSCSREDIISYCGGLFSTTVPGIILPCVWKVQYDATGDNKYLSGYFDVNVDGTIKLFYGDEIYTGSWIFLFVNDELHMNINLEGTSQVALDWNIDRKVIIAGDEIIIQNPPKNIHLKKTCWESTPYAIGDVGPAGGIVFYDKGSYSEGWRYAEAAPNDLAFFEWGCANSTIPNSQSSAIGKGLYNSGTILNFHDTLVNFYTNPNVCSNLNNGTVVAKEALGYQLNDRNDWFLPSENELALLYTNLQLSSLGNFSNAIYWSSTENDATTVKTIDFSNGQSVISLKVPALNTIKVRCIRYF